MQPKLEANAGIYVVKWDNGVTATLDRFHEDSKSNLTAEITVKSAVAGVLLPNVRVNLVSPTARNTLVRTLNEQLPDPNWLATISEMCGLVLGKFREGEPIIELGLVPPRPDGKPRYRLMPLLLEGQPTLLLGDAGHGKGQVAVLCGVLITLPLNALGLTAEPGRMLYLDYEDDSEELSERARVLQRGFGYDSPSAILYRRCYRPFSEEVHEIQRLILENEIDAIVVDSLGLACGSEDLNKEGSLIRLFGDLRSLHKTILVIHHLNREKNMYGNNYIWIQSRAVWELKRATGTPPNILSVALYNRKANRGELYPKPIGLEFMWGDQAVTVQRTDVLNIPDLAEGVTLRQRIIGILRKEPQTLDTIYSQLGMSTEKERAKLRATLSKYKNAFTSVTGKWGLITREEM